ncbi:growth hormone-regulated TBC protein 1-A-like [Aplochiton taeniatus]
MNKEVAQPQHYPNSTKDRVDPYGFERAEDFESYEEMMQDYVAVLDKRSFRWTKLLQAKDNVEKNLKVKRFVRKGVPNQHRVRIWMVASGAQEQLDKNPGYFHSLIGMDHDTKLSETIHTDIHRTFPNNVLFRNTSELSLQKVLYDVLLAYGHHNKAVGYCQGMNFIAGYLIIITENAEKSFWLMDALLGRILPDYYSPAMMGLKTDQAVLEELVRVKAPAVGQVMAQHPGVWPLLVSHWFICLYIDILPVETVLRILDCLFYEGSKILFRVALTLILHHQALIIQTRSLPEVVECFKHITRGAFTMDCHTFMQVRFNMMRFPLFNPGALFKIFTEPGSLSMAAVTKLRQTCRQHIEAKESKTGS